MKSFESLPQENNEALDSTQLPEGAVEIVSDELKDFRQEITDLKTAESKKNETAHFSDLNPEQLTENDRAMFERVTAALNREDNNGGLSEEEFAALKEAFSTYRYQAKMTGEDSDRFAAYLANILTPIYAKR